MKLKPTTSGIEITSFREARNIKDGQLFVAIRDSVEGRDKVTLVPAEDTYYYEMLDNPEAFEDDSFNDMDGDKALNRSVA